MAFRAGQRGFSYGKQLNVEFIHPFPASAEPGSSPVPHPVPRPSTPCRRGPPPPGSSNSCRFRTRPSLHRPGRSSCQRRHATARTRTPTAKRMQTGSLRPKLRRFAVNSGEEKGCIAPKKSARGCDRRRCISNGPLHRARCKAEPKFGFRRGGKRT